MTLQEREAEGVVAINAEVGTNLALDIRRLMLRRLGVDRGTMIFSALRVLTGLVVDFAPDPEEDIRKLAVWMVNHVSDVVKERREHLAS